jgi:hypothetical protein
VVESGKGQLSVNPQELCCSWTHLER